MADFPSITPLSFLWIHLKIFSLASLKQFSPRKCCISLSREDQTHKPLFVTTIFSPLLFRASYKRHSNSGQEPSGLPHTGLTWGSYGMSCSWTCSRPRPTWLCPAPRPYGRLERTRCQKAWRWEGPNRTRWKVPLVSNLDLQGHTEQEV